MNLQLTNEHFLIGKNTAVGSWEGGEADQPNLLAAANLHQSLLELTQDAVIAVDHLGQIQLLNPQAEAFIGVTIDQVRHCPLADLLQFTLDAAEEAIADPVQQVLQTQQALVNRSGHCRMRRNPDSVAVKYSISPLYSQHLQVTGAMILLIQPAAAHPSAHFTSPADRDILTGLVNRPSFEAYLAQAVASTQGSRQQHVLCYLDLDQFNVVNDTCGHVAGDEVLRQISALFLKRVRKTDVLARLGGDEFGLILHQCDLDQAINVINLLQDAVQRFRFEWEGKIFSFSVSIGVAPLDGSSDPPSQVLSMVGLACDIAKGKGRNRLYVYQPQDPDLLYKRGVVQWIPTIYKALEEDRFFLHSQPITPVLSRSDIVVDQGPIFQEVLIRLEDETGGTIYPGKFIGAAERYGLMHLIDRWVIRQLFSHLQQINLAQQGSHHLYSVNLSGASFNDDQFLEFVQEQFELYQVPPHLICFEITETLAITNIGKASELIRQLKSLGCYFALDDFGSGMSSFGYLRHLPIDYLKIDGVFIKELLSSSVALEIVQAINRIAHVIGIKTVAEYVENAEVLEKLQSLGVDYAQGFGIAKPGPLRRV
ncbi:EAL domain-containing protein [Lyngbya confervoides]|uniref:EAL domain-containing protein n=1 Tax=Lyngbya confervoides BDU141951 TaxID=1574623 RepID=A0ABD4T8J1_9CYAN|nr:EAL domain-containing protein [Lyngbya confervoides]MCM1984951.1 EAL domain-containing protein [Lyngbya confervoides BDU141951]